MCLGVSDEVGSGRLVFEEFIGFDGGNEARQHAGLQRLQEALVRVLQRAEPFQEGVELEWRDEPV